MSSSLKLGLGTGAAVLTLLALSDVLVSAPGPSSPNGPGGVDLVPPVEIPPEEEPFLAPGLLRDRASDARQARDEKVERKHTRNLSDRFFTDVLLLARYLTDKGASLTAEDLLAVFLSESGCNPRARNSIGCVGLNQICVPAKFGWTRSLEEYQALPAEAQLPYVRNYIDVNVRAFTGKKGGDYSAISSLGKLYLLNAGPAFVRQPESFVMHRRDPKGPLPNAPADVWRAWTLAHSTSLPGQSQDVYALNRGLDFGKKGYIEVADVSRFVQKSLAERPAQWAELQARLAEARVA